MFEVAGYREDSQPYGYVRGYPVYLATVLVAVHVLMLLVLAMGPRAIMEGLIFFPESWKEIWRWVTYDFVHTPTVWFLIEMFFLGRFGMEIERVFGRPTLLKLYAGLVLLPPLLVTLFYVGLDADGIPLAGTQFSHFCLFLGMCFLYPGALMLPSLPWLTLKVGGSLLLGIYSLMYISGGSGLGLLLLWGNVGLTYWMLRYAGLTARFEGVWEVVRGLWPQGTLTVVRRGTGAAGSGGRESVRTGSGRGARGGYEAKIRPKLDLAPERLAVEEIDAVLDKIARTGMGSLSAEEKAALQRASARLNEGE